MPKISIQFHVCRYLRICMLALVCTMVVTPCIASENQRAKSPYAGAYRIEGWRDYQKKEVEHFFFLHPKGIFLLAAQLRGRENTRIGGHWQVAGNEIILQGAAHVWTNQGEWRTPFWRRFRIQKSPNGLLLTPMPAKNRYGLMGWPNAFLYSGKKPLALPGKSTPAQPNALLQEAKTLLSGQQQAR